MVEKMGMNLTTFFTIYAKKALRERKKPFEISAPAALDPSVVEQKLDEADLLAAATDLRYTSYEVFPRVRERNELSIVHFLPDHFLGDIDGSAFALLEIPADVLSDDADAE